MNKKQSNSEYKKNSSTRCSCKNFDEEKKKLISWAKKFISRSIGCIERNSWRKSFNSPILKHPVECKIEFWVLTAIDWNGKMTKWQCIVKTLSEALRKCQYFPIYEKLIFFSLSQVHCVSFTRPCLLHIIVIIIIVLTLADSHSTFYIRKYSFTLSVFSHTTHTLISLPIFLSHKI